MRTNVHDHDATTGRPGALLLGSALLAASPLLFGAEEPPPRPFLRQVIQLDEAQLAAVDKGEVVTKRLPTTDKAEVAAFGVVKANGTPDRLLTDGVENGVRGEREARAGAPGGVVVEKD